MAPDSTTTTDGLLISANAARRIGALIAAEKSDQSLRLRVSVSGGGCSGFQYGFSLDDARRDDDRVFARDGIEVIVDEISLELLKGGELDYVDSLIGSYFSMKNPNATATCGCGTSFSV